MMLNTESECGWTFKVWWDPGASGTRQPQLNTAATYRVGAICRRHCQMVRKVETPKLVEPRVHRIRRNDKPVAKHRGRVAPKSLRQNVEALHGKRVSHCSITIRASDVDEGKTTKIGRSGTGCSVCTRVHPTRGEECVELLCLARARSRRYGDKAHWHSVDNSARRHALEVSRHRPRARCRCTGCGHGCRGRGRCAGCVAEYGAHLGRASNQTNAGVWEICTERVVCNAVAVGL